MLLAAAPPATAQSGDLNGEKSKIIALENAWGQAESHKDIKALEGLLDDDLVYIRYDGSLWDKKKYLASVKEANSSEDEAVNEAMVAHAHGNSALVTGIYRVKGTEKGKAYVRRERFVDMWVYRNGVWVCVASQVTLIVH